MDSFLTDIARSISNSAINDFIIFSLRNVPGLPPIVQTIHIVSIAAIVASFVFINLRVLNLALPSQNLREMTRRLLPWAWIGLILLFLSGLAFVLARPMRYFTNPVFGWKLVFLVIAIVCSVAITRLVNKNENMPDKKWTSLLAGLSLIAWILVIFAGRWIAYSDYLFPPT